jgi:uncharacterized protein
MKRSDAALAALVVTSLAAAAAVWAPALQNTDVDEPRAVRLLNTATPTATAPSPSPSPTPNKPTPVPDWRVEIKKTNLLENRLYKAGRIGAVQCPMPGGSLATRAAVAAYGQALVVCLDKAWSPLMTRSGNYFQSVRVYAYDDGQMSPCGKADAKETSGFYCSSNRGIYINWRQYAEKRRSDRLNSQVWLILLMGHEYGHHVQDMVSILNVYDQELWTTKAERSSAEDRLELQVSCFGAAFLGANKQTLLRGAKLAWLQGIEGYGAGNKRNRSSYENWVRAGFASADPGSCNTWAAPAARVS